MLTVDPIKSILQKTEFQDRVATLNLEEMEALSSWLEAAIKDRKAEEALKKIVFKKGREVLETRKAGKVTYQLERVKCGKKKCKCSKGKLHGPYWYAYHWNGKKLTSKYIGKDLKEFNDDSTIASMDEPCSIQG